MSHDTVTRDAETVVGLSIRTSNENAHEIGALWQRFFAEDVPASIPDPLGPQIVAVYCEYEGDHTRPYTFLLGRRVQPDAPVPEGLASRTIPAGTFARFVAEGEQPQALIETWGAIQAAPLERRYDADFEVHDPTDPERVAIHVGI